jgi:hypothetical protein
MPPLITLLVAPGIIHLVERIEKDIKDADTNQDPISAPVCKVWLVLYIHL